MQTQPRDCACHYQSLLGCQGQSTQPQHSPKCLPNLEPGLTQSHCTAPVPSTTQLSSCPVDPKCLPFQSINAPRVLLMPLYLSEPVRASARATLPAASSQSPQPHSSTRPFLILSVPHPSYQRGCRVVSSKQVML
jgi:hypothetical protein